MWWNMGVEILTRNGKVDREQVGGRNEIGQNCGGPAWWTVSEGFEKRDRDW